MQNMNSNELNKLTTKDLKEYINCYHLPAKTVIEKGDLVRIIFNTRPIANANEIYYRSHRHKSVPQNQEDKSFFSNIVEDIFGLGQEPQQRPQQSRSRQRQQQRQSNHPTQQQQQQQQQQQRPPQQHNYSNNTTNINNNTTNINNNNTYHYSSSPPVQPAQPRQPAQPAQPRQPAQPAQPARSTPPADVLSIHDLVTAKVDPSSLSVRTLKGILKANFVEQSHVIEKAELVKLVQRLIDQHKSDEGRTNENDDSLCKICLDAQQNCVFLDCGHMATCMDCAKTLIEQKNECPICREPILKLVHVFRS